MDYKYIEQLLERYWEGETSLQEENILRTFFSQPEIPEEFQKFQALFICQEEKEEMMSDDFDARVLEMTEEAEPKTKMVVLVSRLKPLFKAAAIVAIILTLGNAAQAPWNYGWDNPKDEYAKFHQQEEDSVNMLSPIQAENVTDTLLVPHNDELKYYE
jgi:hypothetical protein